MYRELTFAEEDGKKTHKVIVSRLATTSEAAGMILMPVPDYLIGAVFCWINTEIICSKFFL